MKIDTEENFVVNIERNYSSDIKTIQKLFEDQTIFTLTGADVIEVDFKTGKKFKLNFNNRGIIFGQFISIAEERIVIDWNVEGFGRPNEMHTIVEIILKVENEKCNLTLIHKNIPQKDSADAKTRAWTEIFEKIERLI